MRLGVSYAAAVARGAARAHELDASFTPVVATALAPGLWLDLGPTFDGTLFADEGGPTSSLGGVGASAVALGLACGVSLTF